MTSSRPERRAVEPPREITANASGRERDGSLSSGADQEGHRLGLGQVDAAVQEGPARELAGLGQARPLRDQALEQHPGQRRAAVAGDLDRVLAGVRARRAHHRAQRIVDDVGRLRGSTSVTRASRCERAR